GGSAGAQGDRARGPGQRAGHQGGSQPDRDGLPGQQPAAPRGQGAGPSRRVGLARRQQEGRNLPPQRATAGDRRVLKDPLRGCGHRPPRSTAPALESVLLSALGPALLSRSAGTREVLPPLSLSRSGPASAQLESARLEEDTASKAAGALAPGAARTSL